MPLGPAPTGPVDVAVTFEQEDIDVVWGFAAAHYPDSTTQQMVDEIKEWMQEGVQRGLRRMMHRQRDTETDVNKAADDTLIKGMFGGDDPPPAP